MRAGFGGDEIAVVGQQLRLRAGGDVQHVEAVLVPVGQIDRPAGGDEGGLVVADAGMVGHVVRAGEAGGVGADGRFVFAVGGDRQRGLGEDPLQRSLLVDQQVAGAGADEDLDAGRAVGRFQLVDVVAAWRRCRSRS